jgi:putative nucleotidyltransferase with HDIG domain
MQLMPVDLVRGEVDLPLLPEIFQRFSDKLDDPGAKADDFSEIISTDPSLTAKLLRIVNSAYYSFSATITDVSHAITIVGLTELREIILAVSVVEFFDDLPNQIVSMNSFWQHSVLTGLLARELQRTPGFRSSESMFTAGMLHDIGSLVFYNRLPEIARSVLEVSEREDKPRYLVERSNLGFDHADIGGELVRHWGLPEFLIEVVSSHHVPDKVETFKLEAYSLQVADKIARLVEKQGSFAEILESVKALTDRLNESDLSLCIENAKEKLQSVLSAIQPG